MPVIIQDVLKINIVFVGISVLNDSGEIAAFSDAVGTEVVSEGRIGMVREFSSVAPVGGRRLALQRDRIKIDSLPDRTIIEREFPLENDLQRLAEVADEALRSTEAEESPRTFGYNLELVYDQDSGASTFQYVGEHLFQKVTFAPEGWTFGGGAGRMRFNSPDGRWTVQIEPRFNEETSTKVFLNLNFHKEEQRLPDLDEMLRTFPNVWWQAHDFAQRLDEKGAL